MNDNILEFKNVSFKWPDGPEFNNMNLEVKRGEFLLINGPSGSGKSTLLRLACRLEDIASGEILWNATNIVSVQPEKLRQKVALIQQTPSVIEGSIKDNLLLPYSFRINKDLQIPTDDELVKRLAELSIDISLDKDAAALSVGQKQRVCILRTLLLEPDVLLMDEPTSALDPESKAIVEKISERMNAKGTTIIMISHSEYEPNVPFSKIIVRDGQIFSGEKHARNN